jgi:hypothetical protein
VSKRTRLHRRVGCFGRIRSLSTTTLLTALLCLPSLLVPQLAQGDVRCHYSPGKMVLSVTVTGFDEATLRRYERDILVLPFFGPPIRCGREGATVTNTDRVKVLARDPGAVSIQLSGGPFAPGATPDPDASSEIAFTVGGSGIVEVEGGPRRNHFRYMDANGDSGINLNADEDGDLDLAIVEHSSFAFILVAAGGPGADLIDAQGRPAVEMFAYGGGGNDALVAPPLGSTILAGGRGRDRLFGGTGGDLLAPGSGRDLVKAGGGSDEILMRPDKRRDRIYCGTGRDNVARREHRDRLHSCEFVKG